MKLGVLTNLMANKPLDEALKYFKDLGIQMVEIGCGGYPGRDHADPEILLNDEAKLQEFKDTIAKYGLEISALSCHGNPVHPNKQIAAAFDRDMRNGVLLAEKLGIHQINTFSGCPGDCENSQRPNWVTCAWPEDYSETLEWQWNEVLIPYWKDFVAFAKQHGVDKIALELHPGFCVYNTDSLLKLRHAVGPEIGANFDPSHLIWQGMDPAMFLYDFASRVYHVHIKDAAVNLNGRNGILGSHITFGDPRRGWNFVSPGHGDVDFDKIIRVLNVKGYEGPLSIEWEDSGMDRIFGGTEACAFTKKINFSPSDIAFDDALKTK